MAMDLASYVPPAGFKFRLSLTELVSELQLKNSSESQQVNPFIPTVDLFNIDPSEIPGIVNMPWEDEEWYVLSSKRGKCLKRKAKSESWNITGKVKEIVGNEGEKLNAKKSILVRRVESDYVIHEIALDDQDAPFVICILKKKTVKTELKEKSNQAKTSNNKRAKTSARIHESAADISSSCTESGLDKMDSFSEIAQVPNHAQSNYRVCFENNLNLGEARNNITNYSETSQTVNSVSSVDDYEIESTQTTTSLQGHKVIMATSNGISNSEVSAKVSVKGFVDPDENSFDDGLFYHELFDDVNPTMAGIFKESDRQKSLEKPNVSGPLAPDS